MKKRGEITVFLSLTLVCILSLFMGLLESARTAGARLYLTMAANSAMASVMSQYNRNLWDMYHLLFLEYESPEAIGRSFDMYLDFYLEQENLYPMKRKSREVTAILNMQRPCGKASGGRDPLLCPVPTAGYCRRSVRGRGERKGRFPGRRLQDCI